MKKNETINAIICTVKDSEPVHIPVRITLGDHRLRFHSVHCHQMYLEIVGPVTQKPFLPYLYKLEKQPCEIVNISAFIRINVSVQETRLSFVLRYDVKRLTGKGRYTIQEKEKNFLTDADREMVIRYTDRYLGYFRSDKVVQYYNDWAHPLTLEEVTASLTEEQKAKAAKLIREIFAA